MKKVVVVIIGIIMVLTCNQTVFAKDTFKSINKHEEESLEYIIKSYNEKNKYDGLVVSGTYTDKKEDTTDTQVIIVKYNNDGKEIWNYDYGKSIEDKLYYLTYSYSEENLVNGYLVVAEETKELNDPRETSPVFIKLGLDGKLLEEKSLFLEPNTKVNKVIPTYNEEAIINGYLVVSSTTKDNRTISAIAKYNINLDQLWKKEIIDEYYNLDINDIVSLDKKESYRMIMSYTNQNEKKYSLLNVDSEGNIITSIKEDFDDKDNPHLLELEDGYLVYGYNHNVKLKNDKTTSYYVIKYNLNDEEEWETIGNTPVNDEKAIEMQILKENDKTTSYLIMTTNDNDSSIEITKVNLDGVIENKIKKINNEYYKINEFISSDNILYFIGQISCPDDDNCDYDMKSLFLISTEDKVIEVEEEDNTAIVVIMISLVVFSVLLYILRRYQKKRKTA